MPLEIEKINLSKNMNSLLKPLDLVWRGHIPDSQLTQQGQISDSLAGDGE